MGRHGSAKHPVTWDSLFVKFTETQAYITPVLEVGDFSLEQVEALLAKSFTLAEWAQLFQELENQEFPEWFPKNNPQLNELEIPALGLRSLGILSPTRDDEGAFSFQQAMSFDSSDSTQLVLADTGHETWRTEVVPTELLTYVETLNTRLGRFKSTVSKPFRDIEASHRLLVADLKTIHHNVIQWELSGLPRLSLKAGP